MKWTEEKWEGSKLFIGKYMVARVSKSCVNSPKYYANCFLPGIKEYLGGFEEILPGKEIINKAVSIWLKNTGLTEKGVE